MSPLHSSLLTLHFLNVEAEVHDITVLYDVFLALYCELACFAYSSFGAVFDVVFVLDDLGTDESLLKVGVDDTCALRCLPSLVVGPCTYFLHTSGDVGLQVEQCVCRLDEACNA